MKAEPERLSLDPPAEDDPETLAAAQRRAVLAVLGVVLIWAVNVSVMKTALFEVPPLAFNALRFPLGTAILGLLLWRLERDPWPRRHEWWPLVVLGVASHSIYQLCFINGLSLTSASHTAVLISTTPIWVALADRFWLGARLTRGVWAGVALSVLGVTILTASRGGGADGGSLAGDVLIVLSSLTWTFYVIRSRPLLLGRSPLWLTAWAMFIGAPIVVAMGIPGLLVLDWGRVSAGTWGAVVYAGVFALATAYSWWARGVKVLGATRTAVTANLIPVVALGFAWVWLGETLGPLAWLAAAVTLAGVWITTVVRPGRSASARGR